MKVLPAEMGLKVLVCSVAMGGNFECGEPYQRARSAPQAEHLSEATAVWSTGKELEVEDRTATLTGRESERVKKQVTGLKLGMVLGEIPLFKMDIFQMGLQKGVALLIDRDMPVEFWNLKERNLLLEKLVWTDPYSVELVQEVMFEKEGSIQEAQAPAGESSLQHRVTRMRPGATSSQEREKIGRRRCFLLLEDFLEMGAESVRM